MKGVHAEGNWNLILQYDVRKTLQILKERIQSYKGGGIIYCNRMCNSFDPLFKNKLVAGQAVV